MSAMRRIDAAALALLALCAASLAFRLGAVPALTGDEAWIGMFVERLRSQGAFSPHQMNNYTGPLFSWCVEAVSGRLGGGVGGLRALGAACNAAAFLAVWLHLRRRISPEAGAAWAALLAGSAFLLLKSRLAWEVYAFQPLLVAGTLAALARGGTGALVLLTLVGTQNHFIYLSIPASLVVLFSARAAWLGEAEARPLLRSSAAALAAGIAFAFLKSPLKDEAWNAARLQWAAALVLVPAAAAWALTRVKEERLVLPFALLERPLKGLFALTILAFGIWHLAPMIQLLAGPVVYKRVFSLAPPFPVSLALHLWSLGLLALLIWNTGSAWLSRGLRTHERTLLLWPLAFAAVFIVFRHTSSLRYYSLPAMIWLPALACALARLPRPDARKAAAALVVVALGTQAAIWRELAAPGDRRPLAFKTGWRKETSWDFARKDALFAAFDKSKACRIGHMEDSFVAIPIQFHSVAREGGCDSSLVFDASQCRDCETAPFYRWTVLQPK